MLAGSLSMLAESFTPGLLTSTAPIFGRSTGFAPGFAPGLLRSSTPTACWSSGVVWQPAARSSADTMMITRMEALLSFDERAPRRLAHIAAGVGQVLPDAAVGGNRRQHPAPAAHRGEQDHPAVGREAR